MRLLTIDWDFFFPEPGPDDAARYELFDWGHAESPFYMHPTLWENRAGAFVLQGQPLPGLSGEQDGFWSRFRFGKRARLYLSESHAQAAHPTVAGGVTEVWSFDAHHDLGYTAKAVAAARRGRYSCDAWGLLYTRALEAPFKVVYPRWKAHAWDDEPEPLAGGPLVERLVDDPDRRLPVFDRVFVCRSGAWVPTWHDEAFGAFAEACPVRPRTVLWPEGLAPRGYDAEQVEARAAWMRSVQSGEWKRIAAAITAARGQEQGP